MICFWYLVMWACTVLSRTTAQQFYDSLPCFYNASYPGSRYACASSSAAPSTCRAFVVYRANRYYQTAVEISELFGADLATVLNLNSLSLSTEILKPGREVIVPITCSCSGGYFSGNVTYAVQEHANFSEIACDVFEGLVKLVTLREENPKVGASNLSVPIKCACPGNSSGGVGAVRYFLTYAFKEGDYTMTVAREFSVPVTEIWAANHLDYRSTVYSNTTILIPLTRMPRIRLISPPSPPPPPMFLPKEKSSEDEKLRNLYVMASVIGSILVVVAFVLCGLYLRALSRWRLSQRKTENKTGSFNMRSSVVSCLSARSTPRSGQTRLSYRNSCLSPDLLVGIKYSLNKYMVEELRNATRGFSDDSKIDSEVYKGSLNNTEVIIKGCRSEEARQVIDLHSNINHINILSLIGVCNGEGEDAATPPSYLVYDYPTNGCLRDQLSDPENTIRWTRRTQIAFDIATGLHYLHRCIFPSHVHANLSTRNIFVTANWRAKLADVAATYDEGDSLHSSKQWFAPEYTMYGTISEKVDIFAFGGVLLELISARGETGRERLKDSTEFLAGGGNEGRCFEKLRGFVDPSLKDDYPLAEALCLAVLAKACMEDDPQHRPSMDDVIKVLARMHPEVIGRLDECIARIGLDETEKISASVQIPEYVPAKGDFGTNLAVRTRTELDPADWWLQHGVICPELQRIAVRVLTQTSSSVGCEHTWSVYDQLHSTKHNGLSRKRWTDLSYVHYNLRLRESRAGGYTDSLVATFDGAASEALLNDWVELVPQKSERENEEDHCNDEMDGGEEMATTGTVVGPSEACPGDGNVTTEEEDHDHDNDDLNLLDDDLTH